MLYTDLRLKMTLMWITLGLFNHFDSAQTDDVRQPDSVITADVGDDVTLRCFKLVEATAGAVVWYKQKFGHKPRVIVAIQHETPNYKNEFKPPKFSVEKEQKNFRLKIAHVEPSDEAMYYCGLRDFLTTFGNGTFLSVKGDADVKVSVSQMGVWDSVPAGASVTLQCSVLSESRAAELQVLWFRAAPPQSHPQIIYTHHNSSRQCESGSSTHTCVYNLSKNILSLNDTGTYYCAVVACGRIILGNGTRVQMEDVNLMTGSLAPEVISLAVVVAVCVLVIITQAFIICKKRSSEQSTVGSQHHSVVEKSPNQGRDTMELNYAALHFNKRNTKRARKREKPEDCVYSEVSSAM